MRHLLSIGVFVIACSSNGTSGVQPADTGTADALAGTSIGPAGGTVAAGSVTLEIPPGRSRRAP